MSTEFSQTFMQTFIGEKVEIVAQIYQHHTEETQDGMRGISAPLIIHGYILDVDSDFFYIGDGPHEITRCIRKDLVGFVEVLQERSEFDAILEQMPTPTKKEEEN